MNNQFKFKPDKNKYLLNVDTLDSTHKKIIDEFNKKRDDVNNKTIKLSRLKNDLEELDKKRTEFASLPNFIEIRAKLIENISNLENEIDEINNYEDETEYYAKTYQILFNYYDILDGQIKSEINDDILKNNNQVEYNNCISETNVTSETNNSKEHNNLTQVDEWEFDGIQIFNSTKVSTLDALNELLKKNKKEKKSTRKRIKNVETLIKDNNYDIFEFINADNKNIQEEQRNNINKIEEYSVTDRAKLYDDYKTTLEGYNSKKKHSKICTECGIDKVLIYSEGIYACMKCGDVENCIIENEITNYKEPMVEKPTFPYKRKNHFCEWNLLLALLAKVIVKSNGYFLY